MTTKTHNRAQSILFYMAFSFAQYGCESSESATAPGQKSASFTWQMTGQLTTAVVFTSLGTDEQGDGRLKCHKWYPDEPLTSKKFQACVKMAEGRYAEFFPDRAWTMSGTLIGYRDLDAIRADTGIGAPDIYMASAAAIYSAAYIAEGEHLDMSVEAVWTSRGAECINRSSPRWRSILEIYDPLLASIKDCPPPGGAIVPLITAEKLVSYTVPEHDQPLLLAYRSAENRLDYATSLKTINSPDYAAGLLGILFLTPPHYCKIPSVASGNCGLGSESTAFKEVSLWRRYMGRTATGYDDYDVIIADEKGVDASITPHWASYSKYRSLGYVHSTEARDEKFPWTKLDGSTTKSALSQLTLYRNVVTGRHLASPKPPSCTAYVRIKDIGWILPHPRDPSYVGLSRALASLVCAGS